ncbi:MAG: low molecular weight protein arginine phosphatase [bacterium]|nr:low molecular weight protein arginine phosphatase [bacterium]
MRFNNEMKVLFICTGNTCRSYMAQVILEKLAKEKKIDLTVSSAGIQAIDGIPAYPYAKMALKKNGYEDKKHYSKSISELTLNENDLILTMEVKQRDYLKFTFPQLSHKIITVSELAVDTEGDIDDPIALEYTEYEKIFKKIEEYTIKIFKRLIKKYNLET